MREDPDRFFAASRWMHADQPADLTPHPDRQLLLGPLETGLLRLLRPPDEDKAMLSQ